MKSLFIDYNPFFVRAALVEDGELVEFLAEHVSARGHVGNIYKGKVENVLGGMKAAFVNIGLERNGFLYVGEDGDEKKRASESLPKLSPGDTVMCQVVKEQFDMKGARLTLDITLPGYYTVLLPKNRFRGVSRKIEDEERRRYLEELIDSVCPQNMGFIVRSAAINAGDCDITDEIAVLAEQWKAVERSYDSALPTSVVFREAQLLERVVRDIHGENMDRVVVNEAELADMLAGRVGDAKIEIYGGDRNIFRHYGISAQVDKLAERRVEVEGGAYIVIDKTEALTVIDVNTGRYVGSKDLEDTVFRTNCAAAVTIAKQLRLRNISGIVIIDFIDMQQDEHKRAVVELLRAELKKDRLKTSVVSMTNLGLVELTRKRTRLPADSFMLDACPDCMGGRVVSGAHLALNLRDELIDYTLVHRHSAYTVRLNPSVCDCVFDYKIMVRETAGLWKGKRIYMIPDESVKRDAFEIRGLDDKVLTLPSCARLLY